MRKTLRTEISSESSVIDFVLLFLSLRFSPFYLILGVETWARDLNLKVRQRSKNLLVGWYDIDLFAVSPARPGLVYAPMLTSWHDLKSSRRLLVATPLCFSYFLELLARDYSSLTGCVRRLAILELTTLTMGAFFGTAHFGAVLRYASAMMRYESDHIDVVSPLGLRF